MLPHRLLDRVPTPDGRELLLYQHGDDFLIRIGDADLMSSRLHGSEESLARLGIARLADRRSLRVLVCGLGMGFTLRATLDALAGRPGVSVVVVELFADVVRWNREWLGHLAGHPLADPRVRVEVGDAVELLASSRDAFDLVLLDVDNGPHGLTVDSNDELYSRRGLGRLHAALGPGGVVAVWSADDDPHFATRLHRARFEVAVHRVRARPGGKGGRHVIFIGRAAPSRHDSSR